MKIRGKNPLLSELIAKMVKKGVEQPFWKAVAKGLNRPNRKAYTVNLRSLEKHADSSQTVVVPGSVLGSGLLTKKLNIVALRFSGQAEKKIQSTGGTTQLLSSYFEQNPNVKNVRIMA